MKLFGLLAVAVSLSCGSVFAADPAAPAPAAPAPAAAAAPATTTTAPAARGFNGRYKKVGLRAKLRNKFGR